MDKAQYFKIKQYINQIKSMSNQTIEDFNELITLIFYIEKYEFSKTETVSIRRFKKTESDVIYNPLTVIGVLILCIAFLVMLIFTWIMQLYLKWLEMFLDIGLPSTTWLGIVIMGFLALLYWLIRNFVNSVIKRIENLEKENEGLNKEVVRLELQFTQKISDLRNEIE